MCDVKIWYLDMLSNGILSNDLDKKQGRVKTTVEKLIRSKKGDIEIECDTLEMYEQILYGTDEEEIEEVCFSIEQ